MYRTTRTICGLGLMVVLTVMGRAEAYQQQQFSRGAAPTSQALEQEEGPLWQHMQGFMQHMRGMMRHVQDMMGSGAMMHDDDDDDEGSYRYGRRGYGMMGRGGMRGHGAMLERTIEQFTEQLDLSDDQRAQVQTLVRAHAKVAIRSRADVAVMRIDLHQLLDAEPLDVARIKTMLQAIAAKEVDVRLAHITMMQDIRKFLTPEQQKTLRTVPGHMMGDDFEGHHRGMMGPGGMRRHGGMRGHGWQAQ